MNNVQAELINANQGFQTISLLILDYKESSHYITKITKVKRQWKLQFSLFKTSCINIILNITSLTYAHISIFNISHDFTHKYRCSLESYINKPSTVAHACMAALGDRSKSRLCSVISQQHLHSLEERRAERQAGNINTNLFPHSIGCIIFPW